MLKGAYDLLLAKQNEVAAERSYIEAWRDYWIARAELERRGGRKLSAELEILELQPRRKPNPKQ